MSIFKQKVSYLIIGCGCKHLLRGPSPTPYFLSTNVITVYSHMDLQLIPKPPTQMYSPASLHFALFRALDFNLLGQMTQQDLATPQNNSTLLLDNPTFLYISKPHPTIIVTTEPNNMTKRFNIGHLRPPRKCQMNVG